MSQGNRSVPAVVEGAVQVVATGEMVRVRLGRPVDLDEVNAMHLRCTAASRYRRYQAPRRALGPAEWANLTDPGLGTTWVTVLHDDPDRVIAVSHLMRTEREGVCELGLLVQDDWQYRGLGTLLTHRAVDHAARDGFHTVAVMTDVANTPMLTIARRFGAVLPRTAVGTVDLTIRVPAAATRFGDATPEE